MKSQFYGLSLVFLTAFLGGCVDGFGPVNGTIHFDGQPVKAGSITFVKTEGGLAREGAVIENGIFRARLQPGKYLVGKRKQKGFDGKGEEVDLTEELFPDRFNSKTELTQVIISGLNTINLKLESKSKNQKVSGP